MRGKLHVSSGLPRCGDRDVKACVVLEKSPVPDNTGNRRRLHRILTAVGRRFDTTLVIVSDPLTSADNEALAAADLPPYRVIQIRRGRVPGRDVVRWMVGRGSPIRWARRDVQAARDELNGVIGEIGPDVVFASSPAIVEMLLCDVIAPMVVDVSHVERTSIDRDLAALAHVGTWRTGRWKRLVLLALDRLSRLRVERCGMDRAALLVPCSQIEAAGAAAVSRTASVVVPNGVDLPDQMGWRPGSRRILFVGNLGYPPNADAARVLIEQVLPRVRGAFPDAQVDLVGPGVDVVADLARRPGVNVAGFVEDLAPLYDGAEVAVAPLRSGSGTKLKTLEAFAYGVPLVTTPIGVEGLAVTNNIHVRVGSDAEELARHVVHLMGAPDVAHRQRDEARSWVEDGYSWGPICEGLCDLLVMVAANDADSRDEPWRR